MEDVATGDEGGDGAQERGRRDDGPTMWEAVDETGEGEEGTVADEWREGDDKYEGPEDEPATRCGPPFLSHGSEQAQDSFIVDEDEDAKDEQYDAYQAESYSLEEGEAVVGRQCMMP